MLNESELFENYCRICHDENIPQYSYRVSKWVFYNYTREQLDNFINTFNEFKICTYTEDYPLFIERVKKVLKQESLEQIPASIYVNEFYNFEILGVYKDHPDRTKDNTFIFKEKQMLPILPHGIDIKLTTLQYCSGNYLSPISFGTHTTAHIFKAIMRQICPDRTFVVGTSFRRETQDATHTIEFDSVDIFIQNMNYELMIEFIESLFKKLGLKIILRRTKYPYVEPGIEGFINTGNNQIEVIGGGLFLSSILRNMNINKPTLGAGIGLSRLYLISINGTKLANMSQL